MSNQAQSVSDDLLVGAGELYFKRSDDPHGFHHLGNVEEFTITNDVTIIFNHSIISFFILSFKLFISSVNYILR